MGWNYIETCKKSRILESLDEKARFYFVHSYYVKCQNETDILTKTTFGINYVSSFEKDNIIGVQFHPEKSHKFGISLFKNFLERY
jgi:glutamine amidotransferase